MTPFEYEREHYRIMYPTAARPRFIADHPDRAVLRVMIDEQRYLREPHRGSAW